MNRNRRVEQGGHGQERRARKKDEHRGSSKVEVTRGIDRNVKVLGVGSSSSLGSVGVKRKHAESGEGSGKNLEKTRSGGRLVEENEAGSPNSGLIRKLRELVKEGGSIEVVENWREVENLYDKPRWYGVGGGQLGQVPTLAVLALRKIQANYSSVGKIGSGVPDDFLFYLLKGARAVDLMRAHRVNRNRRSVFDALWAGVCAADFKVKQLPSECSSWLECYLLRLEDQDRRMRSVARKASESIRKAEQERKVIKTTDKIYRDPTKRSSMKATPLSAIQKMRIEARQDKVLQRRPRGR